ncbi:MAG: hypothetical protein GY822_17955 [Deltaproteobacteria bacterium]|nr:hypothetical protein [Deltaproteobacteria bacterium]
MKEELKSLTAKLGAQRNRLDQELVKQSNDDGCEFGNFQMRIAKGRPGDISSNSYAESSRSVVVTARMFREASR